MRDAFVQTTSPPVSPDARARSPVRTYPSDRFWQVPDRSQISSKSRPFIPPHRPRPPPLHPTYVRLTKSTVSHQRSTPQRHPSPLTSYLPTLDRAVSFLAAATARRPNPTAAAEQLASEFGEFAEQFMTTFGVDQERMGMVEEAAGRIGRRVSAGGHVRSVR